MVERGTAGCVPVRRTPAGEWFRPADGGAGSLLRLPPGVAPEAVRRVRDAGVRGLLPIGNVFVGHDGARYLRTPQPPGPLLADLLAADAGFGAGDALAVARAVCWVLRALHARGLAHGSLDAAAVLLDPDGVPVVVLVDPAGDRHADDLAAARIVREVAAAWCSGPDLARLRAVAALVVADGPAAGLAALGRSPARPGRERVAAARAWAVAGRDAGALR